MIGLLNIDKPDGISEKEHMQILSFMGNLIVDSIGIQKTKGLFDYKESEYKVLDRKLGRNIILGDNSFNIQTRGLANFMMGDEIRIVLPGIGKKQRYKKVHNFLHTKYLYQFFKDKRTVSDHILHLWYELFKNIGVQFIDGKLNMFFNKDPNPYYKIQYYNAFEFDYYNQISKEKILEKEIELGYVNKTIGDPHRNYAYGHLLRGNMGDSMAVPVWSMKLLFGWSQINMGVTSRKQGKTSTAGEIISKELLAEKKGYGMRRYRMIRFFTDNAKSIGGQVMDYIEDYLGDLVNKEIEVGKNKGKPLFRINKNNQTILCNLTGNKFEVTSVRSLRGGDTDLSDGDGLACDCGIIDEGFRMPQRFWNSFTDRALDESEWILILSTMNEETIIDHWMYDEFIKGEAGGFERYNSIRSSATEDSIVFYNNHILPRFMNKDGSMRDKDMYDKYRANTSAVYDNDLFKNIRSRFDKDIESRINDTLERKDEKYVLKRLFCAFFSSKKVFDVTGRITAEGGMSADSDYRFIGYDMASLSDSVGRVIINGRTLTIEEGKKLGPLDYKSILKDVEKMKNKYENCVIVGDRGGPIGETVAMNDDNLLIDYWIKMTSNQNGANRKIDGTGKEYFTINKGTCFLSASDALSNIFKINHSCTDLIEQFGRIEAKKSERSTTIFYKGKKKDGKKDDDIVHSYVNINALIRILMSLKTKDDIKEYSEANSSDKILDIYYDDNYNENNTHGSFNY